ncbi:MAG TPA: type II toxin-antitoxin system VapC family toxin [Stellaceae bacterium]|nr:type II toxin-antitoxin system VapC family toxin [Stellaceae bacterium]
MPFALDASIVLDWALDEGHRAARVARERLTTDGAVAPSLWWFEVRNGLLVAERRGRASEGYLTAFLGRLARFPVVIDRSPDDTVLIGLARRHRLTVYDAAYLELAVRHALPLATLDAALLAASRAEGVTVLGSEQA